MLEIKISNSSEIDCIIEFIKIISPFILTTVLGSGILYWLQNRSWKNQRDVVEKSDRKRQQFETYEHITTLLDKRLYRSRQIIYAFRSGDEKWIESAFSNYRETLFEWNESINRNYARTEVYLGVDARHELENKIVKDLIFIGSLLEKIKNNADDQLKPNDVWVKIDYVNGYVYNYNRRILRNISAAD